MWKRDYNKLLFCPVLFAIKALLQISVVVYKYRTAFDKIFHLHNTVFKLLINFLMKHKMIFSDVNFPFCFILTDQKNNSDPKFPELKTKLSFR